MTEALTPTVCRVHREARALSADALALAAGMGERAGVCIEAYEAGRVQLADAALAGVSGALDLDQGEGGENE